MSRHLEIERKFLVKQPPPGWKRHNYSDIVQGYFPLAGKDLEIRLRRKGSRHFITIKGGHGPRRLEEEMQIPESKFRSLWSFTRAARIAKRRYRIPYRGHTIEMDVYQRHHRGLVTADIEFPSGHASRSFQPPQWLGREITGSPHFSNAMLARRHALPRQLRLIESWPFTSKDRKR